MLVHHHSGSRPTQERYERLSAPLHDRAWWSACMDAEEKTAGGIIISDTAKEKPMEGEVIAGEPRCP